MSADETPQKYCGKTNGSPLTCTHAVPHHGHHANNLQVLWLQLGYDLKCKRSFKSFTPPFKMYQISVCIAALWRLQGGKIFTSVHLIRFLLTVTQQRAELIYSRVTSDEYLFQVFIVQVQRGDYSPGRSQRQQQLHTCPCASRPWCHQPWCLLHRCRRWYPGNATSEAHLLTKYKRIPATSFWFPTWHLPACHSSC